MGIVVKAEYTNIHHNLVHAHRGILLKGAYGNKVHHNTIYLDGTNTPLYGLQWLTDTDYPKYNVITNNIFDARNGMYAICMTSGGWEGGPTDVHSNNRLNNNCYVAGSEGLVYDGAGNHATLDDLRNKWSTWSGLIYTDNDANSIEADPCFIESGYLDSNGTPGDANDDVWVDGDYHLQSEAGRWDASTDSWVIDGNTSVAIDAGDPNSDWTGELWPHGKRINMGAYGGTPEASMSLSSAGNIANLDNDVNDIVDGIDLGFFVERWCYKEPLLAEDLDRDGDVNFVDFEIFADNWTW
jgi:hypothetical protein